MFHRSSLFAVSLLMAIPLAGFAQTVALPTESLITTDELPSGSLFDGLEGGASIEPVTATDALMTLDDADQIAEVTEDLLPMSKRPLTFRFGAGIISDDNIYLTNDPVSDIMIQYVAGVSYELNKNEISRLAVDYDFTGYHLLENSDNDSSDQVARVTAGYNFTKTKLDFAGSYSHLTGADRQIGTFADRDLISAHLTGIYELGAKTNFKVDANYSSTDYTTLQSYQDFSVRAGFDYKVASKTALGLAGVYGMMETTVSQNLATSQSTSAQQAATQPLAAQQAAAAQAAAVQDAAELQALQQSGADQAQIDQLVAQQNAEKQAVAKQNAAAQKSAQQQAASKSASQTSASRQFYKQLLLTANYEATGKLNFNVAAGMELREYEGEAAADSNTNFTYQLTANYRMREKTVLSLTASERVDGSASTVGVSVRHDILQLGVDQQIGDRFRLAVQAGYDAGNYESTRTDISSNRVDKYLFGKATLTYNITKSAYASLFYELRDQSSTEDSLTYDNNRFGLQLGVTF